MKKETNNNKKPLDRHKIVIDKMVGKDGKPKSLAKAMMEAGYSYNYANNPQKIKKTRSWDVLMKEVLNDELLAEKHLELLNKKEKVTKNNMSTGEIDVIDTGEIDVQAVKAGLDMAYKLKSKYSPEEFNLKFKGFNKEQLVDLILGKISKKK